MPQARQTEVILARGHAKVNATHRSTFEITMDEHLSEEGDCIIAVSANKAAAGLSESFKEALRKPNAILTIVIEAGAIMEQINAHGSSRLILSHPTDLVVRKSDYVCSRTLAVRSDKAAKDLSRELVQKLQDSRQMAKITLTLHF